MISHRNVERQRRLLLRSGRISAFLRQRQSEGVGSWIQGRILYRHRRGARLGVPMCIYSVQMHTSKHSHDKIVRTRHIQNQEEEHFE